MIFPIPSFNSAILSFVFSNIICNIIIQTLKFYNFIIIFFNVIFKFLTYHYLISATSSFISMLILVVTISAIILTIFLIIIIPSISAAIRWRWWMVDGHILFYLWKSSPLDIKSPSKKVLPWTLTYSLLRNITLVNMNDWICFNRKFNNFLNWMI